MSTLGLEVFDKTLQTTHIWLNEIGDQLIPDRQTSWRALGAVLRTLRDRLPAELAAHLGAELPLLVRGAYYDQYRPGAQPTDIKTMKAFCAAVALDLEDIRPVDPRDATRAVLATLSMHIPRGQIAKAQDALPQEVRDFWRDIEEDIVPPPGPRRRADQDQARPN
jgi:uncharacterized protein (DUF2267 family)